jgi:hypothetical protein
LGSRENHSTVKTVKFEFFKKYDLLPPGKECFFDFVFVWDRVQVFVHDSGKKVREEKLGRTETLG